MWVAAADYEDGTSIEQEFPYNEGGNYLRENERQYELECWLFEQMEKHGAVLWYGVYYKPECI